MTNIPVDLTGKLTFVYVYAKKFEVWNEISYSIKSIRKFYAKDAKIFVVGDDPKIPGVTHIHHERKVEPHGSSRAFDIIQKLMLICDTPEIPENFILMYDDIVLLMSVGNEAFIRRYSMGLEDRSKVFSTVKSGSPSAEWKALFQNAINRLDKAGRPTYNYETHLPRVFNKTKVKEVIERYKMTQIPYVFSTLYFNTYWDKPDINIRERKFGYIKYGVYSPKPEESIVRDMPGHIFLNYDNKGLNKELKFQIQKIFR